MIIITRTHKVDKSQGGTAATYVTRKAFADDDIAGVQRFLDERGKVSGYEWYNIQFEYTKL